MVGPLTPTGGPSPHHQPLTPLDREEPSKASSGRGFGFPTIAIPRSRCSSTPTRLGGRAAHGQNGDSPHFGPPDSCMHRVQHEVQGLRAPSPSVASPAAFLAVSGYGPPRDGRARRGSPVADPVSHPARHVAGRSIVELAHVDEDHDILIVGEQPGLIRLRRQLRGDPVETSSLLHRPLCCTPDTAGRAIEEFLDKFPVGPRERAPMSGPAVMRVLVGFGWSRLGRTGLPRVQVTSVLWCRVVPRGRMCIMPKPYPKEFRDEVVRVARSREEGVRLKDIAADFAGHGVVSEQLAGPGPSRGAACRDTQRAGRVARGA